jgi:aspartate/methionine/tyrosine aminotransferase
MFEGSGLMRPWRGVERSVAAALTDPNRFEPEAYFWGGLDGQFLERLLNFFQVECGISWADSNSIVVASGVSHLFDTFLGCTVEEGGLVLSPAPFYHSFAEYPEKWGATWEVIPSRAECNFKLSAEELRAFVLNHPQRSRCKVLVLTNPSVSGAVFTKAELSELAAAIKDLGLTVFVDEVYRDHVHAGVSFVSLASLPGMRECTVTAHSGSKTRGSADYRIGWACADSKLAEKMIHALEYSVNNISRLLQIAGSAVLETPAMSIQRGAAQCQRRFTLISSRLSRICARLQEQFPSLWGKHQILNCTNSAGANLVTGGHSVVLDFSPLSGLKLASGQVLETSLDLCEYLMSFAEGGVALSPCYSCGLDGMYLKLSFADVGHQYVSQVLRNGADVVVSPSCLAAMDSCASLEACMCFNKQLDQAFERGEGLIDLALQRIEHCIELVLLNQAPVPYQTPNKNRWPQFQQYRTDESQPKTFAIIPSPEV